MSDPRRAVLSWGPAAVAVVALLLLPTVPNAMWRGALGVSPEAALLLALLAAARLLRAGGPVGWLGSWRAWLLGGAWALLMSFEIALQTARYATNENLPLYDAALLSRHLYILGRDLYGGWMQLALLGLAVAPFVLWAVGAALLGRVEAALAARPPRDLAIAGAVAIALALVGGGLLPKGRWATPRIVKNVRESWALYSSLATEIASRDHGDLAAIAFADDPDILVYVIESYGRVVEQDPALRDRWRAGVDAIDEELRGVGWSTGSAWDTATVQGGRSWISDASLMFGLHLSHQSEYEHAMALVGRLPNLPRALSNRGYETLLVKPSDRARPGVALEDPFGFDRTAFADDLDYEGPIVGWGRIPDQYTIGFVHDNVLPQMKPPVFAFFHLATAHMPWPGSPELRAHWQDWNEARGSHRPIFTTRSTESELAMRVSRFKRRTRDVERAPQQGQADRYLDTVLFDLGAIAAQHLQAPRRRTLILVFGDHQPPILANERDAEVPVHLIASDPALLQPFLARGFAAGLRPQGEPTLVHEDLYPLLIHALSEATPPAPGVHTALDGPLADPPEAPEAPGAAEGDTDGHASADGPP
ncbi:MAG: hypothetical protein R3F59_23810 [Myxococcota bacterium]